GNIRSATNRNYNQGNGTAVLLESGDLQFQLSPEVAEEYSESLGELSFVDVTVNRYSAASRRCRPGSVGDVIDIEFGNGTDHVRGRFEFDLPLDQDVGERYYGVNPACVSGGHYPVCGWWNTSAAEGGGPN